MNTTEKAEFIARANAAIANAGFVLIRTYGKNLKIDGKTAAKFAAVGLAPMLKTKGEAILVRSGRSWTDATGARIEIHEATIDTQATR